MATVILDLKFFDKIMDEAAYGGSYDEIVNLRVLQIAMIELRSLRGEYYENGIPRSRRSDRSILTTATLANWPKPY